MVGPNPTGGRGRFGNVQLQDPKLTQAWRDVQVIDGKLQEGVSELTFPHFMVKNELVYRVTKVRDEVCEQLLEPKEYRSMVMYLSHSHLLGAHLDRKQIENLWESADIVLLARDKTGDPGLLPPLPWVPVPQPEGTLPEPINPSAHNRNPLQPNRHGHSGTIAEVQSWTPLHPGHHGLCHPIPRSHPPASYRQGCRPRSLPVGSV